MFSQIEENWRLPAEEILKKSRMVRNSNFQYLLDNISNCFAHDIKVVAIKIVPYCCIEIFGLLHNLWEEQRAPDETIAWKTYQKHTLPTLAPALHGQLSWLKIRKPEFYIK